MTRERERAWKGKYLERDTLGLGVRRPRDKVRE